MSSQYFVVEEDGEDGYSKWIEPTVLEGYKLSCCDCALVHDMDFRIYKGKIQFRAKRNNRATGQRRRHKKMIIEKVG